MYVRVYRVWGFGLWGLRGLRALNPKHTLNLANPQTVKPKLDITITNAVHSSLSGHMRSESCLGYRRPKPRLRIRGSMVW